MMSRNSGHGQAITALLLVGVLATTASASNINPPSSSRRTLLATPVTPTTPINSDTYRATDSPGTLSGLQDVASTDGSTNVLQGHYLSAAGLFASTTYDAASQKGGQKGAPLWGSVGTSGTWGQEIIYGPTNGSIAEVVDRGITLGRLGTDQQSRIWMLDSLKGTAYQISTSTSSSGTGTVIGVFKTSPGAVESPALIAVDSKGNAWVANLNTVNQTVGSVVKILSACTGTAGSDYSNGPSTLLSWDIGSSSSTDSCVVQYTRLTDNRLTITAMAVDASDNLWVLAGNSFTGNASTNYLNVYTVSSTGSTAGLMYGPLVIPGGQFGSPGGNGAVVDAAGFLWTGSGAFQYDDNGDGSSQTYSLLGFDTSATSPNNASYPILAFQILDEANMVVQDSDSNIWVAGNAHVTKVFTSQVVPSSSISATLDGKAESISLCYSEASPSISMDVTPDSSACPDSTDVCCTTGAFNAGIVVVDSLSTIYVANTCDTGLVIPITHVDGPFAYPTLGASIPVGSNLQAIGADPTGNVWVAGSTITDISFTNNVYVITNGSTVQSVTGLAYAYGAGVLSGSGDLTGSSSTQTVTTATYTYIHDTGIDGYSKWVGGTIGWTFDNYGTVEGTSYGTRLYTVTAKVGNNITDLMAADSPLPYSPVMDAPVTGALGSGRYLRVDIELNSIAKLHGFAIPTLTEVRVSAYNHPPSASCKSVYVSATDDTTENGGLGNGATNVFAINGTVGSAIAGVCTQGGPITIDNGSFDSDTQEADVLVPTATTITYNSANYTNSLPTWPLLASYSIASQLMVFDSHKGFATCSAIVAIWDDSPPTYVSSASADSSTAPALCTWPPNLKYWCVLDIFGQSGGRFKRSNILPVRDNCAAVPGFDMKVNELRTKNGATPSGTGSSAAGFACTDTDPRSQLGDCTLYKDGATINFCARAQRRNVYTNLDRVYTMQFLVQDAGTMQGINSGTLFSRSLRVPPIWRFQPAATCPRATYGSPDSTAAGR